MPRRSGLVRTRSRVNWARCGIYLRRFGRQSAELTPSRPLESHAVEARLLPLSKLERRSHLARARRSHAGVE